MVGVGNGRESLAKDNTERQGRAKSGETACQKNSAEKKDQW